MQNHLTRDMVITTVSTWIQTSPVAWAACFRLISGLVLLHLVAQTWLAFPALSEGAAPVRWDTTRRLYLMQIGVTCLAGIVSLHVQVRGLAGTEGIVPFPQYAEEKIRRFPPQEELLSWERFRRGPAAWVSRCLNVLEARAWASRADLAPSRRRVGFEAWSDEKLSQWCILGELACVVFVSAVVVEGAVIQLPVQGIAGIGIALLVEVLLGILRVVALLGSTISYRALRGCTGVFTGLQWDSLLLEANMLALPLAMPLLPNCWLPALLLPQQVCVFKCMFGSGVVKRRSRCPRWASSTAMDLHYETQPLPHAVSWYMHKLPHWCHEQECWMAFLVQLPVTFLQWGTWHCRGIAFLAYAVLMAAISSTGSYGFFNCQVLGLAVSILDDSMLPLRLPPPMQLPRWPSVLLLPAVSALGLWAACACGLSMLQLPRLTESLAPSRIAGRAFELASAAHEAARGLGIGHCYGPFATMTTFRWELIFDLSPDGVTWTQLEFPHTPGCIDTRPRWMPLGHFARLDWWLWFLPLALSRGAELPHWAEAFVARLLEGSPSVAALTRHGQLPSARYVRLSLWDYHLSSCDPVVHRCSQVLVSSEEQAKAYGKSVCRAPSVSPGVEWGRWWYRRLVRRLGTYSLKDGALQFCPGGK